MTGLREPEGPQPGGWMDVSQTITWIAFRHAVKFDDHSPLRAFRSSREWGGQPADHLLAALESRASGRPWRPAKIDQPHWLPARTDKPRSGAWPVRARVRRLMRESQREAADLATELRADQERWAQGNEAMERAQKQLLDAVKSGRLRAWGRPTTQSEARGQIARHTKIPRAEFAEKLTIQIDGQATFRDGHGDEHPTFEDIKFKTDKVLCIGLKTGGGRTAPDAPDIAAAIGLPQDSGAVPRKHNGLNYRVADAPLVAEMRELIISKQAGSPEDAARALVSRAVGGGGDPSKVKRLALGYRIKYSSDEPVE